eukprot:CAMPEP_0183307366 /NCGR_PEP_ID=MMETSP0160_2-20130417/17289_1 /TAXON_ID=2839 ORGANISM="Odontella Sinensis, Strain Grunow 1884" /NCGR_SAMPLE_ID=MMETSP0160_2 /ASSEMBLY_ACC=CAM_ASM_000250 /LENGTH=178 /DNA_ID=CAMNT_0025470939 /DNA_START=58 /DNA_END=594 /DNA_ORIENTATION=+
MALRLASQRLTISGVTAMRRQFGETTFRAMSTAVASSAGSEMPSVKDVIIQLMFVDSSGARRKVPGYVGKNLWEVSEMHGIELGPATCGHESSKVHSDEWTEPLYGEGPGSGFDHVLLVGNGADTAKPRDGLEMRMLEHYWDEDEIFPESRLATQVTLTKEMDGMTVYVPDRIVDDIP